jgi:enoyl-CoA hydratase/carnithine racemase
MDLEYTADCGVSVITLNRPQVGNAFTFDMLDAWAAALRNAARDPDVRAVVLTGAGGAFCSGVDLAEIKKVEDTPIAHKHMMTKMVYQVAEAAEDLDKPLIAAVNGAAVGAGMDMALMCDMRFVSRNARFSEGYIRVGLVPGDGGCYYLPRIVGEAKALELLLTGDFVDAEEAVRIGLAARLYEPDELLSETLVFARRLAAHAPISVQFIKSAVRRSRRMDVRTSLDLISSHMAIVMATEDHREAMQAFGEKRPGRFTNR